MGHIRLDRSPAVSFVFFLFLSSWDHVCHYTQIQMNIIHLHQYSVESRWLWWLWRPDNHNNYNSYDGYDGYDGYRRMKSACLMESALWNLLNGICSMESAWWNLLDGIYSMESTQWNLLDGIYAMESNQWNLLDRIYSMESTRWNLLDGICFQVDATPFRQCTNGGPGQVTTTVSVPLICDGPLLRPVSFLKSVYLCSAVSGRRSK